MKLINSSVEIIPQDSSWDGLIKHIERCARVSYKSEDKITEDSAKDMVSRLIKSGHLSCLEHGTMYFKCEDRFMMHADVMSNPYTKTNFANGFAHITCNAREYQTHNWSYLKDFFCEPTEYHSQRISVKFVTSIGIAREILRHRRFSFINESTRWCNYSKGKFGSELTFIIPQIIYNIRDEIASYVDSLTGEDQDWIANETGEQMCRTLSCKDRSVAAWMDNLRHAEKDYMYLLSGVDATQWTQEFARSVLPMDTKSEIIMTGFVEDWLDFFAQRSYIQKTGRPHPDIMILANELLYQFLERGYITSEQIDEIRKKPVSQENHLFS